MIPARLPKLAHNDKGAALVEFAIVLPLLLVFIFGTIEWGLYMYNRQVLTTAVREGARYGSLRRPDLPKFPRIEEEENADICAKVSKSAEKLITFGTDELTCDGEDVKTIREGNANPFEFGNSITVTVSYDYEFLVFYPLISLLTSSSTEDEGKISIIVESTMKME